MNYYIYRQNNSWGHFMPPAVNLIVEADDAEEADRIAQGMGVYSDPEGLTDCLCCGPRWEGTFDFSTPDYDEAIASVQTSYFAEDIPQVIVVKAPTF